MSACVESAMQDLALDTVDGGAAPETAKAVVPEQPGTPDAAQKASEEPNGTADKAKKKRHAGQKLPPLPTNCGRERRARGRQRPRRGRRSRLRQRRPTSAAAKKGGRRGACSPRRRALANAKVRLQKKRGQGGRSEGGPRRRRPARARTTRSRRVAQEARSNDSVT